MCSEELLFQEKRSFRSKALLTERKTKTETLNANFLFFLFFTLLQFLFFLQFFFASRICQQGLVCFQIFCKIINFRWHIRKLFPLVPFLTFKLIIYFYFIKVFFVDSKSEIWELEWTVEFDSITGDEQPHRPPW